MAVFDEKEIVDRIEIMENDIILVRVATVVYRNGEEISRTFKRSALNPLDDLTGYDQKVKAVANAVWGLKKPA